MMSKVKSASWSITSWKPLPFHFFIVLHSCFFSVCCLSLFALIFFVFAFRWGWGTFFDSLMLYAFFPFAHTAKHYYNCLTKTIHFNTIIKPALSITSFPFPTCACAAVLLCFDWQAESYLIISICHYHSHNALPSSASCMCPLRPAGRGRVGWDIRWVIEQRANPSVQCSRDHSASLWVRN